MTPEEHNNIAEKVVKNLEQVYDPEMPTISVIHLGLIYDIQIVEKVVTITHTLTSVFCPMADEISENIKQAGLNNTGAKDCIVNCTFDPPFTLGVKGGGCSGFTYVWDYKKNWPDVKWSKPIDDVLVLDPVAEMFVLGCTVDYVKELGGSYLKVINPNAVASCGCGESFAV